MVARESIRFSRVVRELFRVGCLALLASTAVAACGDSEDANIKRTPKAGSGGDAGEGNDTPTGGGDQLPQGGSGEPEPPLPCEPGERGCDGNTPRECNSRNEWVLEEQCGGSTKVCSGEGVCVPYRLLNAGIDSFGVRPAEGAIVLKEQTLSAAPRTCGMVAGREICVTGGVR
jgi:hypothetical protein